MSTKNQDKIQAVIASNRPDFTTLFGSLELCDCEHCRSIYSPAAYFVNLLQFLDPKIPGVTPLDVLIGNPEKKWPDGKPVIARRPDLAHIELSCENTNTMLPYIDLVNEVLESYIVYNQTLPLKTDESGVVQDPPVAQPNESSPGVTSAELAANPENTRDQAYETLEAAEYPFSLPFNQPLAALRLTLEQMSSSRREVMDLFRRDNSEEAGRALDIEALQLAEHDFAILTGENFDTTLVRKPISDYYGFQPLEEPVVTAWVTSSLPVGAVQHLNQDTWTFAPFDPPPPSGETPHASAAAAGLHQHYFDGVTGENRLKVGEDDLLFFEVYLDPANLPQQVMFQWNDGTSWEHRVYWGQKLIAAGIDGTASLRYMGPLPTAGVWVTFEVPVYFVGVAGKEIAGMAFTLFGGAAIWGAAGKRTPSWFEMLAHVPNFLARTGVSYVELIDLLGTRYINPARPQGEALAAFQRIPISYQVLAALVARGFADPGDQILKALGDTMTITDLENWATQNFAPLGKLLVLDAPDSACDLTLTRLLHLDGSVPDEDDLIRLHRFIRLWRKLKWSMQDLDRAITALKATGITPTFLRQLGQIVQLQAELVLNPQEMVSLWGAIPTAGEDSLYHKLFLNKAVREIDAKFASMDGGYLPVSADLKIKEHIAALLAGLHTRAADLALIREAAGLAGDDAPLNLATATLLYRYVALARALKIAVKDLIALLALSGEKPFSALPDNLAGFTEIDPARTLRFVQLARRVKASEFTPAGLSYLFNSLTDAPPKSAPDEASIQLVLSALREDLARIAAENIPVDDPTGEATLTRLGLLFEAHVVEQLAGLVAGSLIFTTPLSAKPDNLPEGKITYLDGGHLLQASAWLTEADRNALLALPDIDGLHAALTSLYQQPRDLLEQTLAKQLGWTTAETDLKELVLEPTSLDADGSIDPLRVAGKYRAFLAAATPYVRAALSRAQVKQTLADALGLEPAAAALLLEGADGVIMLQSDPNPALPASADFLALVGDGLAATYYENETWSEPALPHQVDPTVHFDWGDKHGFSVIWKGSLLSDKTQRTQFHLRAGGGVQLRVDGKILINRLKDAAPAEYTAPLEMEAGKRYALEIKYFNQAAKALIELRWSSTTTPPEIVPSHRLYSGPDVTQAAYRTWIRLHKATLLVNGLKLTPPEIVYLANPAITGALDLNKLPVEKKSTNLHALFNSWSRWNDFAALRALALSDPTAVLDVMTAAKTEDAQAALVRATGWEAQTLDGLCGAEGFKLKDADYKDTTKLLKLAYAMRRLEVLGAPAAEVFGWAAHAPTLAQTRAFAQEAKRAHKAQYANEEWLEIARSIADQLRENQRTAMVTYLLPQLGFTQASQLFEYFLIDVEMNACMQTSRIKQAISSVQLFIQRCRMNLENPWVPPKMIDSTLWVWMQNYRVWEANLKVFLYPENWTEPELRDDKSPFFRELESELLQSEITAETAEKALGAFLEKVDTVSNLQVCGLFEELQFEADEKRQSVLHVFGHTFSNPRLYYYRQLVTVNPNYRYWKPWERLPLDIQADEVLPCVWNRRLYLFWPVITEKTSGQTKVGQLQLAWSEYRSGKWSTKQVTSVDQALETRELSHAPRMNVERYADELTIVFEMTYDDFIYQGTGQRAGHLVDRLGSLTFRNTNGKVFASREPPKQVIYKFGYLPPSKPTTNTLQFLAVADDDKFIPVFNKVPTLIQLYQPGSKPFHLHDYFFMHEGPRAYLVLPTNSEFYYREDKLNLLDDQPYLLPVAEKMGALAATLIGTSAVADAAATSTVKDSTAGLMGSLTLLTTHDSPWTSAKAGLALADVKSTALAQTSELVGVTLESELFAYGMNKEVAYLVPRYPATFTFETFFHPYTAEFQRRLNRYGVAGLLKIESQQTPTLPKVASFQEAYGPNTATVKERLWPEHKVDFDFGSAFGLYNWEIFFHVPLLIATMLGQNQRFEEAITWFHYIFNPTASGSEPAPQRYWNVLPFRSEQPLRVDDMLKALNAGNQTMLAQWEDLQAHPFSPHRVARLRLSAYQKTVVMKYIDTLIAWGDQLFRRDTIESINQATQLYIIAARVLGPQPQKMPARGRSQPQTYAQLRALTFDPFNQSIVLFENDLPFNSRATTGEASAETTGLMGIGRAFYFCIPKNDKLLGYWDTVVDRLFKIRNCMNIEGVMRELPLFEPPIDPALLVKAAAQGIDLNSVLNDMSTPLPSYRFNILLGKALELTGELRNLGAALLAALEKRDAEHLANLRATHETELLSLVKLMKQQALSEAQAATVALQKSRDITQARFDFYNNIPQRIEEELNQIKELDISQEIQEFGQEEQLLAEAILSAASDISLGFSPGGPAGSPMPSISMSMGRSNLMAANQVVDRARSLLASMHTYKSNRSSIIAGWKRRTDEWNLQKVLAQKEMIQIDKQITAADIRVNIAQQDLDNTTRQIEQSQETEEFLRGKFTNEELYNWTVGSISALFFQCYQLTYDLAKQAERCCRFELGLTTSNFIQFGAWDSQRKGLLSGERLYLQLKQMERAYMTGNRREYELTKHYSLVQNDPQALITLKAKGQCEIDLPEALFDADYPGHFMRRVKNVSLTVPAVVGPYSNVNCTLTLLRDKTRVKSSLGDGYAERDGEEDDRFMTNWARMQAIATSRGQNDSGMFELNFRDERYLPFEGAGAASRWRIELDPDSNSLDLKELPDVILHIHYTAREGGERLKGAAKSALAQAIGAEAARPQARLFSLKHEYPTEWHQFTHKAAAEETFTLTKERFPFLFRGKTLKAHKIVLYIVLKDDADADAPLLLALTPPGGDEIPVKFEQKPNWRVMLVSKQTPELEDVDTEIQAASDDAKWLLKTAAADLAKKVEDLLLVVEYSINLKLDH